MIINYKQRYTERKQPEFDKTPTIKTLVRRTEIVCITQDVLTNELNYINKTMQLNSCL